MLPLPLAESRRPLLGCALLLLCFKAMTDRQKSPQQALIKPLPDIQEMSAISEHTVGADTFITCVALSSLSGRWIPLGQGLLYQRT